MPFRWAPAVSMLPGTSDTFGPLLLLCRLGITSFGHRHYLLKCLQQIRGGGSGGSDTHHSDKGEGMGGHHGQGYGIGMPGATVSTMMMDPSMGGQMFTMPPPRRGHPGLAWSDPGMGGGGGAWGAYGPKHDGRSPGVTYTSHANLSFRNDTKGANLTRPGETLGRIASPVSFEPRDSCPLAAPPWSMLHRGKDSPFGCMVHTSMPPSDVHSRPQLFARFFVARL